MSSDDELDAPTRTKRRIERGNDPEHEPKSKKLNFEPVSASSRINLSAALSHTHDLESYAPTTVESSSTIEENNEHGNLSKSPIPEALPAPSSIKLSEEAPKILGIGSPTNNTKKRPAERTEEGEEEPDAKRPCFEEPSSSGSRPVPVDALPVTHISESSGQIEATTDLESTKPVSLPGIKGVLDLLDAIAAAHSDFIEDPLDTKELHSPGSTVSEQVLFGQIIRMTCSSSVGFTKLLTHIAASLFPTPTQKAPSLDFEVILAEILLPLTKYLLPDAKVRSSSMYDQIIQNWESTLAGLCLRFGIQQPATLKNGDFTSFSKLVTSKPIRLLLRAEAAQEPLIYSTMPDLNDETLLITQHFISCTLPALKDLLIHVPKLEDSIRFNFTAKNQNTAYSPLTRAMATLTQFTIRLNDNVLQLIQFVLGNGNITKSNVEFQHSLCQRAVLDLLSAMTHPPLVVSEPEPLKTIRNTISKACFTVFVHLNFSEHSQLNIEQRAMSDFYDAFPPQWKSADGFRPQELLEDAVKELVKSKRVAFPFKRWNNDMRIDDLFGALKAWNLDEPRIVRRKFGIRGLENRTKDFFPFDYQGPHDASRGFFCIDYDETEYDRINIITDFFQERARMNGRVKNANESPLEYWDANAVSLVTSELKDQNYERLRARDVRERIFRQTKECTQFKVTLVKAVLQKLGARRYLDMSAGWGDRLIGAIGTDTIERYVGVDPNEDLKFGHDEIREKLIPGDPTRQARFQVIYSPFQTAVLPPGETFDLVFTSPPYFDFEIYSDSPTQSISTHRSFDIWLTDFLLVSIKKAWDVLEDNGHLAIHITDTGSMKCCEVMNLFIQSRLSHSVYEGIIGSLGQRKDVVRPIWVWRKDSANADPQRKQDAEKLLKDHHKNRWYSIEKVYKFSAS